MNFRTNSEERHQNISHNSSRLTPTDTLEEEEGNHSISDNSFDTGFEPAQYADIDATNENILASTRAAEVVIETNNPMSVTERLNAQEYTQNKDSSVDSVLHIALEEQNAKRANNNEHKRYDDVIIDNNTTKEKEEIPEYFVDEDKSPVLESHIQESPVHKSNVYESPVHKSHVPESPVQKTHVHESPVRESHVHESPVRESHESPVRESQVQESHVHDSSVINENQVATDQIQENEVITEKEKPQRTINRKKKDSAGPVSRNSSCVSTDSTTSTATVDSGIVMRLDSSPRDSPISSDQYLNSKDLSTSRETLDGDVNALEEEMNHSSSFYDNRHLMQNSSMLDSGTHEEASSADIEDLDTEKVILSFDVGCNSFRVCSFLNDKTSFFI